VTVSNRFEALIQDDLDVDELTQNAAKMTAEVSIEMEGNISN